MNEVPAILNNIQTHWQFLGVCVIVLGLILYGYLKYLKKESDLLLHKIKELDEARVLLRKQDRDKQINTLEGYFKSELLSAQKRLDMVDAKTDGIGHSFDRHREEPSRKFEKLDILYERIDARLKNLEENSIKEKEFKELQATVQKIEVQIAGMNANINVTMASVTEAIKELKAIALTNSPIRRLVDSPE